MSTAIVMPKLGMTMKEGTIVEWLKQPGESVSEGEGVAVISSEKLTSEVEAPTDGVLLTIIEEVDNEVEVGKPIGIIGNEKEAESESSQDVREGKDAALEENAPARQEAEVKGKIQISVFGYLPLQENLHNNCEWIHKKLLVLGQIIGLREEIFKHLLTWVEK
ncbi:biotin/lipoyl-containing protein [Niallia circulans]